MNYQEKEGLDEEERASSLDNEEQASSPDNETALRYFQDDWEICAGEKSEIPSDIIPLLPTYELKGHYQQVPRLQENAYLDMEQACEQLLEKQGFMAPILLDVLSHESFLDFNNKEWFQGFSNKSLWMIFKSEILANQLLMNNQLLYLFLGSIYGHLAKNEMQIKLQDENFWNQLQDEKDADRKSYLILKALESLEAGGKKTPQIEKNILDNLNEFLKNNEAILNHEKILSIMLKRFPKIIELFSENQKISLIENHFSILLENGEALWLLINTENDFKMLLHREIPLRAFFNHSNAPYLLLLPTQCHKITKESGKIITLEGAKKITGEQGTGPTGIQYRDFFHSALFYLMSHKTSFHELLDNQNFFDSLINNSRCIREIVKCGEGYVLISLLSHKNSFSFVENYFDLFLKYRECWAIFEFEDLSIKFFEKNNLVEKILVPVTNSTEQNSEITPSLYSSAFKQLLLSENALKAASKNPEILDRIMRNAIHPSYFKTLLTGKYALKTAFNHPETFNAILEDEEKVKSIFRNSQENLNRLDDNLQPRIDTVYEDPNKLLKLLKKAQEKKIKHKDFDSFYTELGKRLEKDYIHRGTKKQALAISIFSGLATSAIALLLFSEAVKKSMLDFVASITQTNHHVANYLTLIVGLFSVFSLLGIIGLCAYRHTEKQKIFGECLAIVKNQLSYRGKVENLDRGSFVL